MYKKIADTKLTGSQVSQIRANIARRASEMVTRLTKNGLGTLTANGKPYELSAGQIKSIQISLGHILPNMTSTDITVENKPTKTGEEIRQESLTFLMDAGMSEQEANQALDRMVQKAIH